MKAIVLCAGQGQRLMPLTAECPKGMVKIGGRPILERQVDLIRAVGINDITVVGGYKHESITTPGIKKYVNAEYSTTNMVYTLFCAAAEMDGDVIVSYADILYSRNVLDAAIAAPHDIAVIVDLDWESYFSARAENVLDDAESLKMVDGQIVDIGRRVDEITDIEAQYIGLMKFSERALKDIRGAYEEALETDAPIGWGDSARKAYMTDLLQDCVNRGSRVHAVPIQGGWFEVDTPGDFAIAESMLASVTGTA